MGHNINFNALTGRHSFFSVKQPAWHNLGKILNECPTSAQAIVDAGLDFQVEKVPLFAKFNEEISQGDTPIDVKTFETALVPNRFATMRMDTHDILGVVSDKYHIVQNKEAFTFFDEIVGTGEAIYETAGCLGKGETVFITAKLPGHIKVTNQDVIDKYLLLTMGHTGKDSVTAMFTPVRVVCANTLAAALEGTSDRIHVRHNGNAQYNLRQAHAALGIVSKLSDSLTDIYQLMLRQRLTDAQVKEYFIKVFGLEEELNEANENDSTEEFKISSRVQNILDKVWTYYHTGVGQASCIGTLYGAYNAITGYIQNAKVYRTDSSKMNSIYFGDGAKLSVIAFRIARNILKLN